MTTQDDAVRSHSTLPLVLPRWTLARVFEHPVEPLRDLIVERCASTVFPALVDDPVFMDSLTQSVDENVRALRDVLMGAVRIDDVPLANRLRFTSVEAQARVTQVPMQRSYRLSYFLQWQEWSQLVADAALRARVSALEVGRAQQSLTAIVLTYADSVVTRLSESLAGSEEALSRSRHHVRQRLVKELLDGSEDVLSPADLATLDYPLDGWHLAVLLPQVPVSASAGALGALRSVAFPEGTLAYAVRLESTVLWLGSRTRWTDERIEAVAEALEGAGIVAAVSDTVAGPTGFRRAFEQVRQAEQTRAGVDAGVVRYTDVRLEILLLQNPQLAREFLRAELGPLAEDTPEAAKLRATIEASFRFGSHVGAAEHLHLHEHTVRNRLQRAQELLGLQERRTEIQVALRVWRLLATADRAGR